MGSAAGRPGRATVGSGHRLWVLWALVAALAAALLLGSCSETVDRVLEELDPDATAAAEDVPAAGSALELLGTLPVREEIESPPYRRDEFGPAWKDVDGNGCDTRNDILRRDLRSVTTRRGDECIVLTGELTDPYTTRIVRFNRERNASGVQIDHVIPLADAWRTGAAEWPEEKRIEFANDPENLLAVEGSINQQKSDQDAAEWLPPNKQAQCPYVARQVGLKARYGLWVEPAEAEAMRAVLQTCPDQPPLGLTPSN